MVAYNCAAGQGLDLRFLIALRRANTAVLSRGLLRCCTSCVGQLRSIFELLSGPVLVRANGYLPARPPTQAGR